MSSSRGFDDGDDGDPEERPSVELLRVRAVKKSEASETFYCAIVEKTEMTYEAVEKTRTSRVRSRNATMAYETTWLTRELTVAAVAKT